MLQWPPATLDGIFSDLSYREHLWQVRHLGYHTAPLTGIIPALIAPVS